MSSWFQGDLKRLRAALYDADFQQLLMALEAGPIDEVIQLAGDAVGSAVDQGVPGAADIASRMITALDERGWEGDRELADRLRGATGLVETGELQSVPVDLEDLSMLLEGDPAERGGWLDLETGDTWPTFDLFDDDEAAEDAPAKRLWVERLGSGAAYDDMVDFVNTYVTDPEVVRRLERALEGRGAFRRFKSELEDYPDLLNRWSRWSDERSRGRARVWLAEQGYQPAATGRSTVR